SVRGYAGESYDRRQEGRNLSPYTLSASSVRTLCAIRREKTNAYSLAGLFPPLTRSLLPLGAAFIPCP
ncbi:hypothetical protein IG631_24238, partial [Alternaria alternata]